jgi:ankyrin repeat protein
MVDASQLSAEREILCGTVEQIRLNRGLAAAIQQNDTAAVQYWLNQGADPNAFANLRHRAPALLLAVTDYYDDDTPYVDEDEQPIEGTHYFVPMPGNTAIMAALLDVGADIHARELGGEAALMLAVRFSPVAVVTFLIARGADVNARYSYSYGTYDECALHYAAPSRDVDIVRALLDGGADINARGCTGQTPLMMAVDDMLTCSEKRTSLIANIEELLDRGAEVTIRDTSGRTVLDYIPRGVWNMLWHGSWVRKIRKRIVRSSRRSVA